MNWRSSLAARLNILLTLCIAGTALVTSFVDYRLSRSTILEQAERETDLVVADTLVDLENQLTAVQRSTRLLAELLAQEELERTELRRLLQTTMRTRDEIFGSTIALPPDEDAGGFAPYYFHGDHGELLYVDLVETQPDYHRKPWFRDPRSAEKALWSEPYLDRGGGEVLMSTYSVPIYLTTDEAQRRFYGVLTADLALKQLSGQLSAVPLGEFGGAMLLSRGGRVLASPRPELLMKQLHELFPQGERADDWTRLVAAADRGKAGSLRAPCRRTEGMCVLRMSRLPSTGWLLLLFYSEDEILAPLEELLWRMALSDVVGLAVALFAVAIVSRRITRPLSELASITDNVAAGNLDAPMPRIRSNDEVGRLIHSFGSMQSHLRDYIQRLQEETATRNRLQGEMDAAAEIQLAMLPDAGQTHVIEAGWQLWAAQRPAKSVGRRPVQLFPAQ